MFGGYRRYIEALRYGWLQGIPRPLRIAATAAAALLPAASPTGYRLRKAALPDQGYAAWFDGIPDDPMLRRLCPDWLQPTLHDLTSARIAAWSRSSGAQITSRQQRMDINGYLPDDILVKMDRASMAHSIEVRSPLLDYRLVEWAAAVPRAALINSSEGKLPLRALAGRLLPVDAHHAPKQGFAVPLDEWFRADSVQPFLRERLLSSDARRRGLWQVDEAARMLIMHRDGRGRSFSAYLWRLLMLDAWARVHLDDGSSAHVEASASVRPPRTPVPLR
jgi:asparagine synthase (glutamine-hydrolysing)